MIISRSQKERDLVPDGQDRDHQLEVKSKEDELFSQGLAALEKNGRPYGPGTNQTYPTGGIKGAKLSAL